MSSETTLVNQKHTDEFDMNIGRGSHGNAHLLNTEVGEPGWLGNPFPVDEYSREEAISKYRLEFAHRIGHNSKFREAVEALRGKTLACWCAPKACHGDVIIEFLEK